MFRFRSSRARFAGRASRDVLFVWLAILAMGMGPRMALAADSVPPAPAERGFDFRVEVAIPEVTPSEGSSDREVELWLPLPLESAAQEVGALEIETPAAYEIVRDEAYGNRMLRVHGRGSELLGQTVAVSFRAVRRLTPGEVGPLDPAMRARYLAADRLVPIDGIIAARAERVAGHVEGALAKARALYDEVVDDLSYDKSGEGWGRGDALYACTAEKGNCTDFHSLFIGMCRSLGIPARFTIGYPLPSERGQGTIGGYHCWAEFYDGGRWHPVDASEAHKHPERREFLFGHLDPDRIEFTRGRDLVLPGHEDDQPLNYFVYPVLYVDGERIDGLEQQVSYRDATS